MASSIKMHRVPNQPPPQPPSYSAFFPETTTTTTTTTTTDIPKSTVFYAIFPDEILQPNIHFMTENEYQELFSSLHSIYVQIFNIISPYVTDYIWQHEPFTLSISPSPSSNPNPNNNNNNCPCYTYTLPHFHGKTRYGDNYEDEWFIVFLLFEISRKLPNLSIKVWDSDGEFLLFDSVSFIPRWVKLYSPVSNRVFIRNGQLQIVHKGNISSKSGLLGLLGFLAVYEDGAPELAQLSVKNRISSYSEIARSSLTTIHRVRVRVPVSVAKILKVEPCLISVAIEGYLNRNNDSMKLGEGSKKLISNGNGLNGKEELVPVSVRMSRAMYRILVEQEFEAPNCGYPLPPRTTSFVYIETVLGMKIACGFEIMYQHHRKGEGLEVKQSTWDDFLESLRSSGYFREIHSGTNKYRRLKKKAQEYYSKHSLLFRESKIMNAPARHIDQILALPHTAEEFKGIDFPPSDDDAWLYNEEDKVKLSRLERQKQMEYLDSRREKSQKAKEKKAKVSSSMGANVPGNSLNSNMESFIESMMGNLGLDSDASDAITSDGDGDTEDPFSGYGCGVYPFGYDYESDFSYDDFTTPEAFMDIFSDPIEEELQNSILREIFACESEGSSTKENKGRANPVASTSQRRPAYASGSSLLGLMDLQLPKVSKTTDYDL